MDSGVARASERSTARAQASYGRYGGRSPGQALVELAIILPVLLLLTMAALDLGRIFFARITIENSAREGAYEASYGGSYIADTACGASNSVMCAVLNEAQGSLTVAPADVDLTCTPVGGCASGAYGDVVTVSVTGHFDLLTPILAVFFGGTNITFNSVAAADMIDTASAAAGVPTPVPTATILPTDTPIPTPSGAATAPPTAAPTPSAPTCPQPIASFTYSQQNKNKPVVFDGASWSSPTSGSCQITFWRWEYGDGQIDAGNFPSASHDYNCDGCTFNVALTVTNPFGSVTYFAQVVTDS
jgi:Flp pilus assembly protein TadG